MEPRWIFAGGEKKSVTGPQMSESISGKKLKFLVVGRLREVQNRGKRFWKTTMCPQEIQLENLLRKIEGTRHFWGCTVSFVWSKEIWGALGAGGSGIWRRF